MLTDDRTNNVNGLCVTSSHGRPATRCHNSVTDPAIVNSFNATEIRQRLFLKDHQSLLLAVAWTCDWERQQISMFPEVMFMDTTSQTNNEKRALFLVSGKDNNGGSFTAACIFLPSERKWVFQWVFQYCLPTLLGKLAVQRNQACVTDGDQNEYGSLTELSGAGQLWQGTTHTLCEWHLLNAQWRKAVVSKVNYETSIVRNKGM